MILHVMVLDKFLPPFIDFVDEHFGRGQHKYVFITSEKYLFGLTPSHDVEFLHTDEDIFTTLAAYMQDARKIILHGLWRDKVNMLLVKKPAFLNKSYWVMWGGDFYNKEAYSDEQLYVMENVPYMINILDEEIDWVRKVYGSKGMHVRSFFYTSNIFRKNRAFCNDTGYTRILLGHSGAREVRHIEYLNKIKKIDNGSIEVFCPLSYPKYDTEYIKEVIKVGTVILAERFQPLEDFMPLAHYREWLSGVNYAVFSSTRQHGMGNMIDLLGHGCKLFVDRNVSTWFFFKRIGVKLYPLDKLDFSPIPIDVARKNSERTSNFFSEKRLVRDLSLIFFTEPGRDIKLEEL